MRAIKTWLSSLSNKPQAPYKAGAALALLAALWASPAMAAKELNMTPGVTEFSAEVYGLHMTILWICVAMGVLVFGAMFYSMFKHRKSVGHQAAQFSHSTTAEVLWTVIPILILVVMAWPATKTLIKMEQTADAEVTVKITGFQWGWKYEYVEDEVGFVSVLDRDSNRARLKGSGIDPTTVDNYLLDVDKPLVLPTNTKVRFVLTADDVIHSWWVPALGWKRDAIPGLVNEAWTDIKEPGTYRGQCAELCGKDHGFMPIVVIAKPAAEFRQWVAEQKGEVMLAKEKVMVASAAPAPAPNTGTDTDTNTGADSASADQSMADESMLEKAAALIVTPAAAAESESGGSEISQAALMESGKSVYQTQCVACHQMSGKGLPPAFPSLAGSQIVTGPVDDVLSQVINGKPGTAMLAFGNVLSDEDIAATVTYIRNSFGNATNDAVQPDDVRAAKQG